MVRIISKIAGKTLKIIRSKTNNAFGNTPSIICELLSFVTIFSINYFNSPMHYKNYFLFLFL